MCGEALETDPTIHAKRSADMRIDCGVATSLWSLITGLQQQQQQQQRWRRGSGNSCTVTQRQTDKETETEVRYMSTPRSLAI